MGFFPLERTSADAAEDGELVAGFIDGTVAIDSFRDRQGVTFLRAVPPFRAPAACWWARTMVESTATSQSTSPAASASACTAASIALNVPSNAHLRKRVYKVCQEP